MHVIKKCPLSALPLKYIIKLKTGLISVQHIFEEYPINVGVRYVLCTETTELPMRQFRSKALNIN